jgi:multidrug efflux pump subunit AcrB
MKSFNLSDWALGHRSLVWYFMIAFMAAGLFAYLQLGRQEDPDFTIKTMVIGAQWPGASPEEMTRQVTDRIEKKLEELESLDYTKSVTVAGQTTVFVYLRDTTKAADVAPTWARVRNMIADIKGDFPQGVIGPGFNDRFGDVFGNIYAFTSDGLSQRQLRGISPPGVSCVCDQVGNVTSANNVMANRPARGIRKRTFSRKIIANLLSNERRGPW